MLWLNLVKLRVIPLNDHVQAPIAHGGEGIVDTVLANDGRVANSNGSTI